MKYLKVNGKPVQIPTKWEELTFEQYLKYQQLKKPDMFNLVAIFTGIPAEAWERSKEVGNFYMVVDALEFITKQPKKKIRCPDYVDIGDKTIEVPKDLGANTVKQYEDMRVILQNALKENKDISPEIYPQIVSVYLCEPLLGEYSMDNWRKAQDQIVKMSFYDVVGISNFFLKSLIGLRVGTRKGVRLWNTVRKKLMRAFGRYRFGVS